MRFESDMSFRRLEPLLPRLSRFALVALLALGALASKAHAADSLYEVAKVAVDTTAKNAVAARANGMALAQQRAMKILLERIVPPSLQGQLPAFTNQEIEAAVLGVAIRKEQTSTTRYIATLDVRFNEYAVKQLLANYAIPFSEERAPSISVLPVMLAGDSVAKAETETWRKAWEELDLSHSITPATVLQPRADLDAGSLKRALAGDPDALVTMKSAYGYGGLVIAVGEVKNGKFRTRLAGEDAVGPVTSDTFLPATGGIAQAAPAAAAAALATLENRWKVVQQGGALPGEPAAYQEGAPVPQPGAEGVPAAPGEVPRNVVAVVEFSGLRHWQEIRSRLTQIAGLQGLEVNALSARAASVTFDFAGSLDNLQAALAQNGFAFDERNGTFVVRSQ